MSARSIGIRHRIKMTKDGEARPTEIVIITENGSQTKHELPDEQSELDFVQGIFPTSYRKVGEGEDLSAFRDYQILKNSKTDIPEKVPAEFDGLRPGDTIGLIMGGSGNYLAFALAQQAKKAGATIMYVAPFVLKDERGAGKIEDDAALLARLVKEKRELFSLVTVRDEEIVLVRELLRKRIDAMKDRIACDQRLRSRFIGKIFCAPNGLFPQGSIEKAFAEERATDVTLSALEKAERSVMRELEKALDNCEVYREVFSSVEGLGPAIASRLVASIGDIRRFATRGKLRKFLGVHVLDDGRFPRRRNGEVANWNPDARQALFLLGDQFNRRPDSTWGKRLIANKAYYLGKHPEPIVGEGGKKKYTKAHIHKMAIWRTLSQFVNEVVYDGWWNLYKDSADKLKQAS